MKEHKQGTHAKEADKAAIDWSDDVPEGISEISG